jgi:cytochrome oxidase Cu insertion factor (SCO1/SenC/PrrC family)
MIGGMSWREGKTKARSHLARSVLAGILVILVSFCLLGGTRTAAAHEKHKHPAATPPPGAKQGQQSKATKPVLRTDENYQREYFTDLPLFNQDGKPVRFYTDMLQGKVVLISFIYTNCTDICPILMPNLAEIQNQLGDRFGRGVHFVSISVDPESDTPEELKEYGEKYGAKAGWTFLTGKKENIDWVVYKLGQYTEDFEDHTMLFLLGDVKNARWAKMRGDLPPEAVAARLLDLLERR